MVNVINSHVISYTGKILFEPENKTKKHMAQASWKKIAMILFEGDVAEYYSWFMKNRFNLELNKPLRGAHVTFINDGVNGLNNSVGTLEEKEAVWEALKTKWDGKEISVTFNLRPFNDLDIESDEDDEVEELDADEKLKADKKLQTDLKKLSRTYHWWLIVDHKFRNELHEIRSEVGLAKPYFGLHMTFGILTQNFKLDKDGNPILDSNGKKISIFNHQLEHAKYLNVLHEKGFIEMNKDYGV